METQIKTIREITLDSTILWKAMDCIERVKVRLPGQTDKLNETSLYLRKIHSLLTEIVNNEASERINLTKKETEREVRIKELKVEILELEKEEVK